MSIQAVTNLLDDDLITSHTTALAELGRRHDLVTAVPTCGDWTLAELISHLAEVQGFWAHIISNRPAGPDTYAAPARPLADQLPDLLDASCHALVSALRDADPADTAWSWSDDHTVAFSIRRQTHEAIVHHVDGVLAIGAQLPDLEPSVAADGVDELVTVMLSGVPEWAAFESTGATLRLIAADTTAMWNLGFGRMTGTSPDSGATYDLSAFELLADLEQPTTTITARALDLELWMWGRRADDAVAVTGDPVGADRLRAAVVESTQ